MFLIKPIYTSIDFSWIECLASGFNMPHGLCFPIPPFIKINEFDLMVGLSFDLKQTLRPSMTPPWRKQTIKLLSESNRGGGLAISNCRTVEPAKGSYSNDILGPNRALVRRGLLSEKSNLVGDGIPSFSSMEPNNRGVGHGPAPECDIFRN